MGEMIRGYFAAMIAVLILALAACCFAAEGPVASEPRVREMPAERAPEFGMWPAAEFASAPSIDGDLADWPSDAVWVSIPGSGSVMLGGWQGETDCSVRAASAWDAQNLYLAFQVTDNLHVSRPSETIWTTDSIQVAIDPLRKLTKGAYGPHDSEFTFTVTDTGESRAERTRDPQAAVSASGVMFAGNVSGAITTYEIAIPWGVVGSKPGLRGPDIGLTYLVNDNDGTGRRGCHEPTRGIGSGKDPSSFVRLFDASYAMLAIVSPKLEGNVGTDLPVSVALWSKMPLAGGETVVVGMRPPEGRVNRIAEVKLSGKSGLIAIDTAVRGDMLKAGVQQLSVEIAGKRAAPAKLDVVIGQSRESLLEQAKVVRAVLTEAESLAKQCEAKGIATDYERVTIATTRRFVEYSVDDMTHGRNERANHVMEVIKESIMKTRVKLKAYLAGKEKPLVVPRYVTGPIDVKDGVFWGDTVVPATGKRERRPVFFTGFGHFSQVTTDIPAFPEFGCNIIQIELGANTTVPAEGELARGVYSGEFENAAKNNMTICWLASPHYFPAWAYKKWPSLKLADSHGFIAHTVDAPQTRKIQDTHIRTCMDTFGNSPALHSVCLSNEPTYTGWNDDIYRVPLWHDYLKRVYGSIDKLNSVNGTSYGSFDAVPVAPTGVLPPEREMTPLRYDQIRFNMEQFADFHASMSEAVHTSAPGVLTHAKVMNLAMWRDALLWGCDPEQFAYLGDLNGNDCSNIFTGFGDNYCSTGLWQNAYYDIQYSMRKTPVVNTENHLITDREQRLVIPPEHTDAALMAGAIHGQGATCIWSWERTYDRTSDFEGLFLHRPENVMAVGRAGLDLMRLSKEVTKLQGAPTQIAVLYSLTSQIWSQDACTALRNTYEAMSFTGLPIRLVSERAAIKGELMQYEAVILPDVKYESDDLAQAIVDFAKGGGKVWVIGSDPLSRSEHGAKRTVSLPGASVVSIPGSQTKPRDTRDALLRELAKAGLSAPVLMNEGKAPAWGVECRSAEYYSGYLVFTLNQWGKDKAVNVTVNGRPARRIFDLRAGKEVPVKGLVLKPLEALLLRVE